MVQRLQGGLNQENTQELQCVCVCTVGGWRKLQGCRSFGAQLAVPPAVLSHVSSEFLRVFKLKKKKKGRAVPARSRTEDLSRVRRA